MEESLLRERGGKDLGTEKQALFLYFQVTLITLNGSCRIRKCKLVRRYTELIKVVSGEGEGAFTLNPNTSLQKNRGKQGFSFVT